jgi:hypothetical protein
MKPKWWIQSLRAAISAARQSAGPVTMSCRAGVSFMVFLPLIVSRA